MTIQGAGTIEDGTTDDGGLARTEEFAAIESYGVIGDGESVALAPILAH